MRPHVVIAILAVASLIVLIVLKKKKKSSKKEYNPQEKMTKLSNNYPHLYPDVLEQSPGYSGYTHNGDFQRIQGIQQQELYDYGLYDTGSFYDACINKCQNPMSNGCREVCMNLTDQNAIVDDNDPRDQYGNPLIPKTCMQSCQEGCLQIYDDPLPYNVDTCRKSCQMYCSN